MSEPIQNGKPGTTAVSQQGIQKSQISADLQEQMRKFPEQRARINDLQSRKTI